jgi:hypothetical protein
MGFGRTGTSLVTRLLSRLGMALGPDALLAPHEWDNGRGYWEPRWMIELNEYPRRSSGGGSVGGPRVRADQPGGMMLSTPTTS